MPPPTGYEGVAVQVWYFLPPPGFQEVANWHGKKRPPTGFKGVAGHFGMVKYATVSASRFEGWYFLPAPGFQEVANTENQKMLKMTERDPCAFRKHIHHSIQNP